VIPSSSSEVRLLQGLKPLSPKLAVETVETVEIEPPTDFKQGNELSQLLPESYIKKLNPARKYQMRTFHL
jgi:hypothetical protein